jgi:hypothetical protein
MTKTVKPPKNAQEVWDQIRENEQELKERKKEDKERRKDDRKSHAPGHVRRSLKRNLLGIETRPEDEEIKRPGLLSSGLVSVTATPYEVALLAAFALGALSVFSAFSLGPVYGGAALAAVVASAYFAVMMYLKEQARLADVDEDDYPEPTKLSVLLGAQALAWAVPVAWLVVELARRDYAWVLIYVTFFVAVAIGYVKLVKRPEEPEIPGELEVIDGEGLSEEGEGEEP